MSFGDHPGLGSGQAPTDCLRRPVEVPPAEVGSCASGYPEHRDDVQAHRGSAAQNVLPDLFKGDTYQIPREVVTNMPINQAGVDLQHSTQINGANWTVSCVITGNLVIALRGTAEFWSGDHTLLMGEGMDAIRWRHAEAAETALGEARAAAFTEDACWMGRIMRVGVWLSVLPYTVNGTYL